MTRFAPREIDVRYRADGAIVLRSPIPLDGCRRHICDYLADWAEAAPDRSFLAERGADGAWRHLTYGEAWARARAVGQRLLERGLGQDRPLAILSGNSIEHAVMTFGAMTAGVPVVPLSPSYSVSPGGLVRLADIVAMVRPAMVFAQSAGALGGARALAGLADIPWISAMPAPGAEPLAEFEAVDGFAAVEAAFAGAAGTDIGKILFTSGSTGMPKGVPNSQSMLCHAIRASSLLLQDGPVVVLDWLPWHHTMGGNSTLHGILRDGGTMYIDDGRPLPGLFDRTIRNLKDIPTTLVQNVPAGFQMLVPAMETDDDLRRQFFSRLERVAFGGASLPSDMFRRMQALAIRETGAEIPFVSGYGATETGPGVSATHWASEGKGELGLPVPGCDVKLVPVGDRFEIRVRGPNVFSGYLGRPDLTAAAFDDEGFYRMGDAVQLADPADPSRGLLFAGRTSENFKLSNGSFVTVGELRAAILGAVPGLGEIVVAGHDRDDVRLIAWLAPGMSADRVRDDIERYNRHRSGATRRVAAFVVASEPPSMAAGEITDKAYVNQRAVLANRAGLVRDLYDGAPGVTVCGAPAFVAQP